MLFRICTRHTTVFSKILDKITNYSLKMTDTAVLNRIKTNAINAEKEVAGLKQQLEELIKLTVDNRIVKLKTENTKLTNEVARLINELTVLETGKGISQISIPGQTQEIINEPSIENSEKNTPVQTQDKSTKKDDKKKEKQTPGGPKTKVPKEPKETVPEADVDVSRLDFRVGRIVEVSKHPDADSLYVEKVDCGEAAPRTVVSGLVKYVPLEEMENRMVVVLCNLKPAKMRGVLSEAMVMCASTPEHVEILTPPRGSQPGDLVHCEGYPRNPDSQLNPKKKIFETVAPDLLTNGELIACYKGKALYVPEKGNVVAPSLKNVNVK